MKTNRTLSDTLLVFAVFCDFIQRHDFAIVLNGLGEILEKHKVDTLETLDALLYSAEGKT